MNGVDLLRRVRTEIKNLDSDEYIKDDEGFIIDCCFSEESLMKLLDTMIEKEKENEGNSGDSSVSALDELESLEKEIAQYKRNQNSSNKDYYTGFISALSMLEGAIAIRKGILDKRFKVYYTVLFDDREKVSPIFSTFEEALKVATTNKEVNSVVKNVVITETDVSISRVWSREEKK